MGLFYRPTRCEIDLPALRHNLRVLAGRAGPGVEVIAVVKSNAYGHGAPVVARELQRGGVRWFATVALEEALELRSAGIRRPILVLGILDPADAPLLVEYGLTAAVFSERMVAALQVAGERFGRRADVHVKIDTAMGRLGARPDELGGLAEAIRRSPAVRVSGVFTHLAKADTDEASTTAQVSRFEEACAELERAGHLTGLRHVANSAATLRFPQWRYGGVRPGLALYGISPFAEGPEAALLRPVLTLKTRVLHLKGVPAGTPISYGATFETARPTRVATLPIGYADGLSRSRSNPSEARGDSGGGVVLVRGRRAPIIGRITMDLTMVDVTDVPGCEVGDDVVLIGRQGAEEIAAWEWARQIGTIPYEVLCSISARIPRVTVGEEDASGGEPAQRS